MTVQKYSIVNFTIPFIVYIPFRAYLLSLLVISTLIISCRKNNNYELPVRGNVQNNCTGKGWPDILVQLSYDEKLFSTYTDANGDFDFGTVPLHRKKKDGFKIGVPRLSTDSFELYGVSVILRDDDIGNFHQFATSASFNVLFVVMPDHFENTAGDSISIVFTQRTLKSIEPNRIAEMSMIGPLRTSDYLGYKNYVSERVDYPMGWWHVEGQLKTKGKWTTVKDSIYLGIGATVTYTIPW